MSNRFHTSDPLAAGEIVLTGAEAHHLAAVRRFQPGDRVVLFNGDGREYPAEIIATDRKRAVLNVLAAEAVSRELPFELTIASAMPKGDRGDFLIEKLVELGVARFVPLVTERTIVQPKESRIGKLAQAVIEASKQCGRNALMAIDELTRWNDFLKSERSERRAVLHPGGEPIGSLTADGQSVAIAIGPEGGFTEDEIRAAEAAGWECVSLGSRILRVETAALTAAAWIVNR